MLDLSPHDKEQFRFVHTQCETINSFYNNFTAKDSSYSVRLNAGYLDIEVVKGSDPRVFFTFNGAVDRQKIKAMPAFSSRTISKGSKASFVFISDPTLYLDSKLTLSWYAGNRYDAIQRFLPEILSFISRKLGAKEHVFFGGSGGGFASLYYSRFLPNSLAVVWNPQTDILKYSRNHVEAYAETAYKASVLRLPYLTDTNLPRIYEREKPLNKILYMQSITDQHVQRHLAPFLQKFNLSTPDTLHSGWLNEQIYLHLSDWSDGHTPPPREALIDIIAELSAPEDILDANYISHMMEKVARRQKERKQPVG